MKKDPSFGVIGMGNMATAIISRALETKFLTKDQLQVSEINPIRQDFVKTTLGIICDKTLEEICSCDVVMIATKPQGLPNLLEQMKTHISKETLVLSIVTGFTTDSIYEMLGTEGRIIRIMPNTPVMVGNGMCALTKGPNVTEDDMTYSFRLFRALGSALIVPEEKMDVVAALSGSGPAYFFYIIESLISAGIEKGLSKDEANLLAIETIIGSAMMLKSSTDPISLRQQVTSPGGSTAEAIKILQGFDFEKIFKKALQAAIDKNIELSR